jgi:hypothetical protein
MNRKNIFAFILTSSVLFFSCGGNESKTDQAGDANTPTTETPAEEPVSNKGIGKFQNVELTHPLDETMVKKGQSISEVKCLSCHKLTEEKLVGPGWRGVTDRRTPEWIMNFVTNVDEMLEKDPNAQAMLEVCMVRMPNQNLKDDEARSVFEFMRKNDGKN